MEEVWKPIEGYEGLYEVSNLGRVRSTKFRNNKTEFDRIRILKANDNGRGYPAVTLSIHGKTKTYCVHRLVALAFIPNPQNLPDVDHIDHNRNNNVVTNLQWLTKGDNVRRSKHLMHGLRPRKKPTTNTGEMYISKQKRDGLYRVTILHKQIGVFDTLEEAKEARDEALKKAEFIPNR